MTYPTFEMFFGHFVRHSLQQLSHRFQCLLFIRVLFRNLILNVFPSEFNGIKETVIWRQSQNNNPELLRDPLDYIFGALSDNIPDIAIVEIRALDPANNLQSQ